MMYRDLHSLIHMCVNNGGAQHVCLLTFPNTHSCLTGYLDEVAGDVSACNVQAPCQVGQAEALVYWTDVRYAIARVHHHTGQKTWSTNKHTLKLIIYNSSRLGVSVSDTYPMCALGC